jgi:hypothetical protein
MKSLLVLLFAIIAFPVSEKSLTYDFGNSGDKTRDWVLLSDNVMGGVTRSNIEYKTNSVVLSGDISLDNFGGFASIKTTFSELDLSSFSGVKIRFKSENQQFAFTLEDSRNWTRPNYKNDFASKKPGTWETAVIYFKDFKEYLIGEPTGNKLNPGKLKNIVRLGIITTEKKEGPFTLEVDYIEFIH